VLVYAGCAVPEEYLYDLDHDNWVHLEADGTARLGMTDLAQTRCGKIVSLSFKPVGRRVARGRALAVIESAKWVGPFPAPLTGTVVATNADVFARDPLIANRDPYGAGWLVRLAPEQLDDERRALVDAPTAFARFRAVIDREGITCMRCAD
jgi:glycine cleavage system H protein